MLTTEQKLERLTDRVARLERQMNAFGVRLSEGYARNAMRPKVTAIQQIVARHHGLLIGSMRSRHRQNDIAHPRQVAMSLSYELASLSLEEIAKCFCRDHGTVSHAIRAVSDRCATSTTYKQEVDLLRAQCVEAIDKLNPFKSAA